MRLPVYRKGFPLPALNSRQIRELEVPAELEGERIDRVLATLLPDYSRSRLSAWLKAGRVRIDARAWRPSERVRGGEHLCVDVEPDQDERVPAQPIALDVVYADEAVLVIDKPPNLIVHPGAGNPDGTLQNALLHYDPALQAVPRAGIVHRLDKDTSGLMVVARTLAAHKRLVAQMQARAVRREYLAVVCGVMVAGGSVDQPIARHPRERVRMAVHPGGRQAVTHYRVLERFRAHTLVRVKLETGRTHQIRVHMAWLRYPLVGDPTYGRRLLLPKAASERLAQALRNFRRQALHAQRLSFTQPLSGRALSFEAPSPPDLAGLIEALRADAQEHAEDG